MNKINFYFIEFALFMLIKNKQKNIFIGFILSLMIFILVSIFQVSYSLKEQVGNSINSIPDIIIQDNTGGFLRPIKEKNMYEILPVNGVTSVYTRVWGTYEFNGHSFIIVGIDPFEKQSKEYFQKLFLENIMIDDTKILIGNDVRKILDEYYYEDEFHFLLPNGKRKGFQIENTFNSKHINSAKIILTSKKTAKEILGLGKNEVVDISVLINNPLEIDTVKFKIESEFPNFTVITREMIQHTYDRLFNFKGGLFLSLFIISLLTFFMIVFDKLIATDSNEKKEIAILKSLGWSTNNILQVKFYEAFFLSVTSFLLGTICAYLYLYITDGYIVKDLFISYKDIYYNFNMEFYIYLEMLLVIFFITIPIYILASIYPSWKIAITDVDEILR